MPLRVPKFVSRTINFFREVNESHWETQKFESMQRLKSGKSKNPDGDLALYSKADRKLRSIQKKKKKSSYP